MSPVPLSAARRASTRCCTCLHARFVANSSLQHQQQHIAPRTIPVSSGSGTGCRFFGATSRRNMGVEEAKRRNHYERLEVRHDASPAEIKKSFYRLSKTHHPDANPSDPTSSSRFSLLSESYTLLSDASRRKTYDRDVLRLHEQSHSAASSHPRGSYSSSQAGGRSPSGLSRRRTTFRGPPPSFYRSGGWGGQAEKRQKAHDESTGFNNTNTNTNNSSNTSSSSTTSDPHASHPGMGPGSDPFSHAYTYTSPSDAPHFDRASHKRTHEREDLRRRQRSRRRAWGDDGVEFEPQTSLAGHFAIVSGILAVTFLAPFVWLQVVGERRRKKADY